MSDAMQWSQFDWDTYDTESTLKLCSLAAQGLWMRLLCICHREGGYLKINGRAPSINAIARVIGHAEAEILPLLKELETEGVYSRTAGGLIYSRRMLKAAKKSANGRKGGSPKHRGQNDNPGLLKPESESESERDSPQTPQGDLRLIGEAVDPVRKAFDQWNVLAKRLELSVCLDLTERRRTAIRERLAAHGGLASWTKALASLERSAWCLGQTEDGFKATLDFVIKPDKFLKLLEGGYERRARRGADVTKIEGWSPWLGRVARWRANMTWETHNWGPAPGQPGCEVPPEFLEEDHPGGAQVAAGGA
jgi:hypothetical protein